MFFLVFVFTASLQVKKEKHAHMNFTWKVNHFCFKLMD